MNSPLILALILLPTLCAAQDLGNMRRSQVAAQAQELAAKGDVEGARGMIKAALETNGYDYDLVLRYAYYSYLLKDYPEAAIYYNRAAALGPKEQAPLEGLLDVAYARGQSEWKDYARALLEMNPNNREANLILAYDAFLYRHYAKAAGYYGKVLESTPNDGDALLGQGWCNFYFSDYQKAAADFEQVLNLNPRNASAKSALAATPKTLSITPGFNYAWLKYQDIPLKSGGYVDTSQLAVTYKRLTVTPSFIYTLIRFEKPIPDYVQREGNLSSYYAVTPSLFVLGDFDYVSVNDDPATNTGKIMTGGLNYSPPLPGAPSAFASLGGYYTYSRYPEFRAAQWTPHVGFGWRGIAYAEVAPMYINLTAYNEQDTSTWGTLALGPWKHVTLIVKGYSGRQRLQVEEWGTVVANNQDSYRDGWRAILSATFKELTVFGIWGKDDVTSAITNTDYTSLLAVGGVSWRFGLSR